MAKKEKLEKELLLHVQFVKNKTIVQKKQKNTTERLELKNIVQLVKNNTS